MFRPRRRQVEPLENRYMLSVTVAEQEVNDNTDDANAFALASDGRATLIGTMSDVDDRDYFRFSPSGDFIPTLSFSLTSTAPPGIRPRLEIQDVNGDTIAQTDPGHGIVSGNVPVTFGTTYFVRIDDSHTAMNYQANFALAPVVHSFPDSDVTVEDGAPLTIDVLANDVGMNPGDAPTLVSVSASGLQGSVSIAPGGGAISYSIGTFPGLEVGHSVDETFSYTMAYAGGTLQATSDVTVTVWGVNHAPFALDDTYSVNEDAFGLVPVLDNDLDVDVEDSKRVIALDDHGTSGNFQIPYPVGQGILFNPSSDYNAMKPGDTVVETVDYTMVDGAGVQSSATLTLTVTGANDAPVAMNNTETISEDAVQYFLNVLPDDTDVDTGDTLSVASLDGSGTPAGIYLVCVCSGGACVGVWYPGTPAVQGTIEIAPGGSGILYTPPAAFQNLAAGQTASDAFRYTVEDEFGAQSIATVVVVVEGRNERVPVTSTGTTTTPLATPNLGAGGSEGAAADSQLGPGTPSRSPVLGTTATSAAPANLDLLDSGAEHELGRQLVATAIVASRPAQIVAGARLTPASASVHRLGAVDAFFAGSAFGDDWHVGKLSPDWSFSV